MKFTWFLLGLLVPGIHSEVSSDAEVSQNRQIREAPAAVTQEEVKPPTAVPRVGRIPWKEAKKKYNLADPVSEDYPVIFNIILFVAVALVLAVIAIAVSISTMDPGRDSLIYRVTSGQKAKKDN